MSGAAADTEHCTSGLESEDTVGLCVGLTLASVEVVVEIIASLTLIVLWVTAVSMVVFNRSFFSFFSNFNSNCSSCFNQSSLSSAVSVTTQISAPPNIAVFHLKKFRYISSSVNGFRTRFSFVDLIVGMGKTTVA